MKLYPNISDICGQFSYREILAKHLRIGSTYRLRASDARLLDKKPATFLAPLGDV